MKVVIVDSGGANIGSICYALERIGVDACLSADANEIQAADRLILPGVGSARRAMEKLHAKQLVEVLRSATQPILGICLGMQLLFDYLEEGDVNGLGLIKGRVNKMCASAKARVPHMGWNGISHRCDTPLLFRIPDQAAMYFVHSFAAEVGEATIATTTHDKAFASVVQHRNHCGVQFHPERSGTLGAQLLRNFLSRSLS